MKINANNRNIAITAALSAGVVAYVVLLFLPTQRSIGAMQEELTTHRNYITQQELAATSLTGLQAELETTRAFSQQWREAAPDVNRLAPAIGTISDCASRSGVTTLQLTPQPVEAMALLARAPVSMVCEGSFEQVFDLVREIESLPQTVWIEQLQLSSPKNKDQVVEDQVRCELTLVIFADKADISH